MLSCRIYKRDIYSPKYFCPHCGSHLWSVARVRFLFWKKDLMYCEKCAAANHLTFEDFKNSNKKKKW